jgi:hypothetical protein
MRTSSFLLPACALYLLLTYPAAGQTWHIITNTADSTTDTAWNGFGYRLIKGSHNVTSYNSTAVPTTTCAGFTDHDTLGIQSLISGQMFISHFFAPSSSYWHFQVSAVGKVLYDSGNLFLNPRTGTTYPYRMYFASQAIGNCGHNGEGTAYSTDGLTFSEGPTTAMIDSDTFYCNQFTSCPLANEIFSPLLWSVDNNYYAAVPLVNPSGLADCTKYTDWCYPTDPTHAGTATYVLQSTNGLAWTRYNIANGDYGRISRSGIDATSPCYHAAWLLNVDWAYEPVGQDFYMTRSFASNYGGSCSPGKLPDRVQVYKAHGAVGVFYGPWQLLIDLGCSTSGTVKGLGFQPDSATIIHDGHGNVVLGGGGSIGLIVNASSNTTVCGAAPSKRYAVYVGP